MGHAAHTEDIRNE